MFFLLFVCWIVFNQNFTLEIALTGLFISGGVCLFACKFMGYDLHKDFFVLKRFPGMLFYVLILFKEILKANVVLFKVFVSKRNREPVIIQFRTGLKTHTARSFLANSITLTPGTITVAVEDDKFTVHCFDRALAAGLDDTVFEKQLLKLEKGYEYEH